MQDKELHGWREWYTFAGKTLGYKPQEATEYANLRFAEELNRRRTSNHPAPAGAPRHLSTQNVQVGIVGTDEKDALAAACG